MENTENSLKPFNASRIQSGHTSAENHLLLLVKYLFTCDHFEKVSIKVLKHSLECLKKKGTPNPGNICLLLMSTIDVRQKLKKYHFYQQNNFVKKI